MALLARLIALCGLVSQTPDAGGAQLASFVNVGQSPLMRSDPHRAGGYASLPVLPAGHDEDQPAATEFGLGGDEDDGEARAYDSARAGSLANDSREPDRAGLGAIEVVTARSAAPFELSSRRRC